MKRKILAAILACVMLFAVAVPALAATDPLNPTLSVPGTTQAPTINIQMPTDAAVIVNPYKLTVTLGKDKKQDQIVSPVMSITNLSDVPLQVCAQVTYKKAGNLKVVADTAVTTGTDCNVALDLKYEIADKAGTAIAGSARHSFTAAEETTPGDLGTDFAYTTPVAADATKNVLAAANAGKVAAAKGVFNFQFAGKANEKATAWTAKDTISPSITFKFIPQANTVTATP